MNHLNLLIVDDDINKISSIINAIRESFKDSLFISQASNVQDALELLQRQEFHLLITDLKMPLKFDDPTLSDNAGEALINMIYKKKNRANVPMYIIALTQFEELGKGFKGAWKVWHYDSSEERWRNDLRDLVFHISLVKSKINFDKIETIFLEGYTDMRVYKLALDIYFPQNSSLLSFETIEYGAGASWVERQLFIWAKSLNRKQGSDSYLKAVGIFDNDDAGNAAIGRLRTTIIDNSAESKTFSILKHSEKYSPLLKSIRAKGIELRTSIEDLIGIKCWHLAKTRNLLETRNIGILKKDNDVLKDIEVNKETLLSLGLTDDEILMVLFKVKEDRKIDFINAIALLDEADKLSELISIKYIIMEIFEKLRVPTSP